MVGDATKEEVLEEAGIERAKGLIAVVSSDANNVFITLTAAQSQPQNLHCGPGRRAGLRTETPAGRR